ncbi:MAG: methionyl-tRNA formyltransferase [Nitrospirae bacterium]|nr:methionyl-tRNA formyltransferase [Nitrospirota bacterium]
MKIIFMGTPEFAVPSLDALLNSKHNVAAIVTQPDKPAGREKRLTPPPVKVRALKAGLTVLQPERMKDEGFIKTLSELIPDIIVVAAFGKILPSKILHLPKHGCINVHASLLPKYRGAAPINWAIINGEKETGITIMQMDEGLDTGDILLQEGIPIAKDDTTGTLSVRLSQLSVKLLIKALEAIDVDRIKAIPQDNSKASFAPILKKGNGRIDWTREAENIYNMVRGMDPWPGAFTYYKGEVWRVWKTAVGNNRIVTPGTVINVDGGKIDIACGKGAISITEMQPANKKRMAVSDFLRGNKIETGIILGA